MADKIQLRGDSKMNWDRVNPILLERELVLETDSIPYKVKVGRDNLRWADLPYASLQGEKGEAGKDGKDGVNGKDGLNGKDGEGTGDMLASTYDPVIKSITGKASGTANADVSLTTLFSQTDMKSALIPTGFTYDLFRADRDQTYNYLYVDCHDSAGVAQNPTSLVVTMYVNNTLGYTSPAITTATFTATVALTISTGDLVRVVTSNTTGLTGGVLISPRMVNR